jgi:(p)ppGpp synthase/HD superfamily hydrolase
MANLQTAIEIAVRAHAGQTEKNSSIPYITHPLRVMSNVQGESAMLVAVLHDVLEDTSTTAADLRTAGFSEEIIAAVESVTRPQGERYTDFVVRSKQNQIGRQVKLADLMDNYNLPRVLFRLDRLDHDLQRIKRYVLSYQFLTDQITEAEYRQAMGGA